MIHQSVRAMVLEWFQKNRKDTEKRFSFTTANGETKILSLCDIAYELEKDESEIKDAILKQAEELDETLDAGISLRKQDEDLGQAW